MDKWSINNHHNAIIAYFEPECSEKSWKSKYFAPGHSYGSKHIYYRNTDFVNKKLYGIKSLGPDPSSTYFHASCIFSNVSSVINIFEASENIENFKSTPDGINVEVQEQINDLRNEVMGSRKSFNQTEHNQDDFANTTATIVERFFDNITEQIQNVREKCSQSNQYINEKAHKLETFQQNMEKILENQKAEFLEVIAKLQAYLNDKLN